MAAPVLGLPEDDTGEAFLLTPLLRMAVLGRGRPFRPWWSTVCPVLLREATAAGMCCLLGAEARASPAAAPPAQPSRQHGRPGFLGLRGTGHGGSLSCCLGRERRPGLSQAPLAPR